MTHAPLRRYVMIGAPVTSVRTPPLLEAFLAGRGIDARVETRHVEPAALTAFVADVRADPSIGGLCVTMPHKNAIALLLDGLEGAARTTRSVNAVRRTADGQLIGGQFDGIALVGAVKAAGLQVTGRTVHLAGLGGAGLAIAEALLAQSPSSLVITEPDADRRAAAPLSERVSVMPPGTDPGRADILVNATPLGMAADDPSPFSASQVARAMLVADIVADPPATALAALAAEAGTPLVTGRDMVKAQIAPIGNWLLGEGR
ncbi:MULTISPECIES: shikimate dehydrogenase [unclassified Roseitalea]|uniref:shikimate dehydrogenase family protein n=1 Tax=unclassified Roseitalea TaxID=2639107 RepID=UPI00273ECF5F|nr:MULTISPECIES: shikimate dehydrogenase [unclassified Roseitalea]